MKYSTCMVLFAAVVLAPLALEAQVNPQRPGGGRQRMQLERQIRGRFQEMIRNQLNLTEEEMQAVRGVMESFQEDRMALSQAQASLRHRLQDPALPTIDDGAAEALLQEMIQVQEGELGLYRREQEQLLTLLSPSQLIRFYSLREGMARRIQQLRQGRGGPGGGPAGRPGGVGLSQGGPGRKFHGPPPSRLTPVH